jgi:hypothetical protein
MTTHITAKINNDVHLAPNGILREGDPFPAVLHDVDWRGKAGKAFAAESLTESLALSDGAWRYTVVVYGPVLTKAGALHGSRNRTSVAFRLDNTGSLVTPSGEAFPEHLRSHLLGRDALRRSLVAQVNDAKEA